MATTRRLAGVSVAVAVVLLTGCGNGQYAGAGGATGSSAETSTFAEPSNSAETSTPAESRSADGPVSTARPAESPVSTPLAVAPDGSRAMNTYPLTPGVGCEGRPWPTGPDPSTSATAAPERAREPLPDDFMAVALLTCSIEERITKDGAEWTYRVERRATDGLDRVLAALRAPLAPKPAGDLPCTADFRSDPWFVLRDSSGREVLPVVPHEKACGKPIDVGLEALSYVTTKSEPLREQLSPAQRATQCAREWKNEPKLFVRDDRVKNTDTERSVTSKPKRVCVYGPGDDPDVGQFTGGAVLSAADADAVGNALRGGPGNATNCKTSAEFAVVHTADGIWSYVELSECRRLVLDGATTYTAPVPKLVAAIEGLDLKR